MDSEEHICNPNTEWDVPVVLSGGSPCMCLHTQECCVCVFSADSFNTAMKAIWF